MATVQWAVLGLLLTLGSATQPPTAQGALQSATLPTALGARQSAKLAVDKETWVTLSDPKKGGPVYHLPGRKDVFFYRTSGFSTDYDGAPKAYHPKGKAGGALDYTANAGKPGNWFGIVTTNGKKDGEPTVQGPSDPAPGFYVSSSALADRTQKAGNPRRYVDASIIPYASLPPEVQNLKKRGSKDGANQGDFGSVVNLKTGKVVHIIVADSGPRHKIGEGSLALRKALELKGAVDLAWIIYPRSKHAPAWPVSEATIAAEGERLFKAFGGVEKVKSLFPAAPVKAAPAAPVKAAPAAPVKAVPAAPVKAVPAAPVKAVPAAPVKAKP